MASSSSRTGVRSASFTGSSATSAPHYGDTARRQVQSAGAGSAPHIQGRRDWRRGLRRVGGRESTPTAPEEFPDAGAQQHAADCNAQQGNEVTRTGPIELHVSQSEIPPGHIAGEHNRYQHGPGEASYSKPGTGALPCVCYAHELVDWEVADASADHPGG